MVGNPGAHCFSLHGHPVPALLLRGTFPLGRGRAQPVFSFVLFSIFYRLGEGLLCLGGSAFSSCASWFSRRR